MKIFSLQSKTSLLIWSIIPGLIIDILVSKYFWAVEWWTITDPKTPSGKNMRALLHFGFPYRVKIDFLNGYDSSALGLPLIINGIIWIAVIFIILLVIRHFKNKNGKALS